MATPWGEILKIAGQTVKLGSSIAGNIAAKRAERRMRHRNDREMREMVNRNQRDYEQQYYADPLATAANQRTLTMMQDYLKEQRKNAAAARAVGAQTEESAAAAKAQGTAALADAASQMAAASTARRDVLRDNHQTAQDAYANTRIGWNKEHFQNRLGQIKAGVQAGYQAGDMLINAGNTLSGQNMPASGAMPTNNPQ